MGAEAFIIWLIVGGIAGWLAGMVVTGSGYGLIGDIIVGIVGGFIAGWLLPQIGIVIGGGIIAAVINAFIGAVILLIVLADQACCLALAVRAGRPSRIEIVFSPSK